MAGLFDGIKVARTGILSHRTLLEVTGNNIANAANKHYSRQEVRLDSMGSYYNGEHFFGSGVEVSDVVRIRDELLDNQLRESSSASASKTLEAQWLQRLETIYNEPSDTGISAALTDFWDGFAELSTDPESLAARANIMSKTEHLASMVRDSYQRFTDFQDTVEQNINGIIEDVNTYAEQIATLNKEIFDLEVGTTAKANDSRDKRDQALDELAKRVNIRYNTAANGMINVFIGSYPAVLETSHQGLKTRIDPLDPEKIEAVWEDSDQILDVRGGELAGVLEVRDVLLPQYKSDLDLFASTLIDASNAVYSNGVALSPQTVLDSHLGISAFGVLDEYEQLNLLDESEYGSIHVSFYDAQGDIIRSSGILVDGDDSFNDIVLKLADIKGLNASMLSQGESDDTLRLQLDSGDNDLGEVGFAISKNAGGFDTSGFLDLLGFNQTDKLVSTSATPAIFSRDLNELKTPFGVQTVAEVLTESLGLSGKFTINGFETGTETGSRKGYLVEQFSIDVESDDSIQDIMDRVNNTLQADYEIQLSYNSATDQLELTTNAQTDADGKVVLSGSGTGVNDLRLAFSNSYRFPEDPNDQPPEGDNGLGDNTGFFGKIQLNALFEGTGAEDIAFNSFITSSSQVNAGYSLTPGDNAMAVDMVDLQFSPVAMSSSGTIADHYQDIVSNLASDVNKANGLAESEELLLQNFEAEKARISGVNLDEELSNMIIFQRAYEANARMLTVFSEMLDGLLNI